MSRLDEVLGTVLAKGKALAGERKAVPLEALVPQSQPRKRFEGLEELAASIKEHGILQPLIVRPLEEGKYAIIAGERRYRAAKIAGLTAAPVLVRDVDESEARRIALIENLQREDLNPYEETVAILELLSVELEMPAREVVSLLQRMLHEEKGRVAHNVMGSEKAGKIAKLFLELGRMTWQSFVQNRLPLLTLPDDLKAALEAGEIPYTAALELKKVEDETERKDLLEEVRAGLSVRALKEKVRALLEQKKQPAPWHREALKRLARVKPEKLPPEKRAAFEAKLKELLELLEG